MQEIENFIFIIALFAKDLLNDLLSFSKPEVYCHINALTIFCHKNVSALYPNLLEGTGIWLLNEMINSKPFKTSLAR